MKKRKKKSIDIEFTEQKSGLEIMKMLMTLNDWMNNKKRKILLWLTSLKITKTS